MDAAASLQPKTEDLWNAAVAYLPEQERVHYIDSPNQVQSIAELLQLTKDATEKCEQKAWRFKRKSGEEVVVRDVLAKVARWINHFKVVGDTVVQYDPTHAALPWAGVRFVLQICVDYFETQDFLLEKIPQIAEQICRCTLMETLLVPSPSNISEMLKQALIKVYARILAYLARVKAYFQKTTRRQVLQSIKLMPSKLESAFEAISVAQKDVESCFQMASVKEQLDRLTGLKDAFVQLEAPMNRWNQELSNITDTLGNSRRQEILKWISQEPYLAHHKREQETFLKGTGDWLLSHPTFKQWKDESASSILWLHGIPGSGKSKLTSLVIEDTRQAFQKRLDPPPAYFYCSHNPAEPGRSDPETIIASIVRQLSSVGPGKPLLPPTISAYQSNEEEGFAAGSLQLQDSGRLLLKLLDYYPMATIIIDALDECRTDTRGKLLEFLENILVESSTLVKIFVSSRDDHDIVYRLQNYPGLTLSSEMNSRDITYFVQSETASLVKKGNLLRSSSRKDELSHEIAMVVSNGARGMFRWASLQLDALCKLKTDDAILERLGRLPDTLEKLYQELLEDIQRYPAEADRQYAVNALAWLLCAQRRLDSTEFLIAVSIIPGRLTTTMNRAQVLDLCRNLIVFDSTLDSFRFAHLSVREFLEMKKEFISTANNRIAAECCLTSLMVSEGTDVWRHVTSENSKINNGLTSGLYSYASFYWAPHCQNAANKRADGYLSELLGRFLSGTAPKSPLKAWRSHINHDIGHIRYEDRLLGSKLWYCQSTYHSSLTVASTFNFDELILNQLSNGHLVESNELTHCAVLASHYGCLDALLALLHWKTIPITEDVVLAAADNRTNGEKMMALLLEKKRDQIQITEDVVMTAAGNYRSGKKVMTLLLREKGDQVQITKDMVGLLIANFDEDIMSLLLEKMGDQIQITEDVVKAVADNKEHGIEVMALLLQKRGDQAQITENMVKVIATRFDADIMALLLEKRGDQVRITRDVVKAVAKNEGNGMSVMAVLLEKKANQTKITGGMVKKIAARFCGTIVELLFDKMGDQIQITEDIIEAAAGNWQGKEVMELLLEKAGDQVQITEGVVKAAAKNPQRHRVMAVLLEERGDEVQVTEDILKAAAGNRRNAEKLLELFLEQKGDQVQITEDVVKTATRNWDGEGIMALLFEKRGNQIKITEDVIRAAAGSLCGKRMVALLREKKENQV